MSEADLIKQMQIPVTKRSLVRDLRQLGLESGMTVIVHSSLKSIGWICGGEVAVVQALLDVLTEKGTLVMPTHSANLSDPKHWENPAVPEQWQRTIKEEMPAYDPKVTPTFFMGRIVEVFRCFPGVIRSDHPTESFAAWGHRKSEIIAHHSLDFGLGEASPLARLYDLEAKVLLIGVGYENNTSMHLAEYRAGGTITENASPIFINDQREWTTYKDLDYQDEYFEEIGARFEKKHPVNNGKIGQAHAKLIDQRALVDFTTEWFKK
ncbi:AAC(3) family N-acetyltransferase [Pullulanibacillus camelliae]|uniref:Aminoglycoside N(3)-acetyltransferase n=1 Tax=Pullulanibacillus camelliae TaxID=1707096 RepID=A0A8J2YJL9_9BACL|nr:AAC(3) family N-acetyltransferase [Pullulanibacillus camelliae]GGE47410.1 AAC(3) family N-acetyltransferase [Pullulanibacillus camelliae]